MTALYPTGDVEVALAALDEALTAAQVARDELEAAIAEAQALWDEVPGD